MNPTMDDHVRDIRLHIGASPVGLKPRDPLSKEVRNRYTDQLQKCGWTEENLYTFRDKVTSEFTVWASELIKQSIRIQTVGHQVNPVHFLIRGEPSAGKTTELKRIVKEVLHQTEDLDLYPLYSEFQYARSSEGQGQSVWNDVVTGCCSSDFEFEDHASSFEAFVKFTKANQKQPVVFIDTLDILLLDSAKSAELRWSEFLIEATEHGVPIVWTCRPSEWRIFQRHMGDVAEHTLVIDLPYLKKSEIHPFPYDHNVAQTSESKPIFDEEVWNNWSQRLQAYVPLFAHRASLDSNDRKNLLSAKDFFQKLQNVYSGIFDKGIQNKNPHEVLTGTNLPTSLYYRSLKYSISERLKQTHSYSQHQCEEFFNTFEDSIQDLVAEEQRTFRLRFSFQDVKQALSDKNFEINRLGDIFDVCESYGLIQQFGRRFEFSHQLLFEEVLFLSDTPSRFSHFPSIQIRLQEFNSGPTSKKAISAEIEENMLSFQHWTGALLSYLPEVCSDQSDLHTVWDPWIKFSQENLQPIGRQKLINLSWSENAEKRNILSRFIEDKTQSALFLNGAPGTGKTYFCFNFLEWHLINDGNQNSLDWRYVTLSPPLVDHFKREWDRYKIDDKTDPRLALYDPIDTTVNRSIGARSIEELLSLFLPNLNRSPDSINLKGSKFGMLSFNRFKEHITSFYDAVQAQVKRPSTSDAWDDYRNIWHDSVTGEPNEITASAQASAGRMSLKGRDFTVFDEFVKTKLRQWKLLEELCFMAIGRVADLPAAERSLHQHDLLMIDEVQDLHPCVLTFLLCLTRNRFDSKRILIAGDRFQTVNRSGFGWQEFSELSFRSLQTQCQWIAKDKFHALENLLINPNGDNYTVETLRTPWRNAPRITKFNDLTRASFGHYYGAKTLFEDYEVEANQPSEEVKNRDKHSKITVCIARSSDEFNAFIELLQSVESDVTETSDVALLTPYSHLESKLDQFQSFAMFDGDSVKGLEFDGVVVAQPYELLSDEAASSIGLGNQNSASIDEERISKWFQSNTSESLEKRELFMSLYDNIRTRMNVLFSRPKFTLLVILRSPFGSGLTELEDLKHPQRNTRFFDIPDPTIIDPSWVKSLQINVLEASSTDRDQVIDALRLPEGIGDTSGLSRIQRAVQAEQMREGRSVSNIVNLWRTFLKNPDKSLPDKQRPNRSACILSGSFDLTTKTNPPPTVLYALRKQTVDSERKFKDFIYSKGYVCERFLSNLRSQSKSPRLEGPVRGSYRLLKSLPYNLYADFHDLLPQLMHEVLFESLRTEIIRPYPQILQTLLAECFGITNISIEKDAKIVHLNRRMSLLIDPKLVEENGGLVVKYSPPSFEELVDKISSYSEQVLLDQSNDFDAILLSIIQNLHAPENRAFMDRCISYLETSKQSLKHLNLPELESAFWVAAKEMESSQVGGVLKKLGPFIEARTSMFSIHPELARVETRGVHLGDSKNLEPSEHYRVPLFTPNEEGELHNLESSSYSESIAYWASLIDGFSAEELEPIARISYHLTWYTKRLPSASLSNMLIQHWNEGLSEGYQSLVNLWWDHLSAMFGLHEKSISLPRQVHEKQTLLDLCIPVLKFLELKKQTNPQHRPMQRVWVRKVIHTCHSIFIVRRDKESDQEKAMEHAAYSALHLLFNTKGDSKQPSGYVQYKLRSLITETLATKVLPILVYTSIHDGDLRLRKNIQFEINKMNRLFGAVFSKEERSLFEELGATIKDSKSIEAVIENFRFYSNASVEKIGQKSWWPEPRWRQDTSKSVPFINLNRTYCLYWQATLDLLDCLNTSPQKNLISAFLPHAYLSGLTLEKRDSSNMLGQLRNHLKQLKGQINERESEVPLRMLMGWLHHSPSNKGEQDISFPANRVQPNTRSILLKNIFHETGEIHQLDWELLLMISTTTRWATIERVHSPWVEFETVRDELSYALATNLDVLEILRSDNSVDESIEVLRLASSTLEYDSVDVVTNFIDLLESPHDELRARFKNDIDGKMKRWNMRSPWWEKVVKNGYNANFVGDDYHENLLLSLNRHLLERGRELFKSQFNDN